MKAAEVKQLHDGWKQAVKRVLERRHVALRRAWLNFRDGAGLPHHRRAEQCTVSAQRFAVLPANGQGVVILAAVAADKMSARRE
jgi:hypothetical protein